VDAVGERAQDPEEFSHPTPEPAVTRTPGFVDRYVRRNPLTRLVWRITVGLVGTAIVVTGIILLPLPGPGWLIIFLGLGVLSTEFEWARRLLDYAKAQVDAWTGWVTRQSLAVRLLIGLGTLAIVAAAAVGYVAWRGIPGWLPFV